MVVECLWQPVLGNLHGQQTINEMQLVNRSHDPDVAHQATASRQELSSRLQTCFKMLTKLGMRFL